MIPPDWLSARVAWFASDHAEIPTEHPTISKVLGIIRQPSPKGVDLVQRIRATGDKDERTRLKHELPAVTPACDLWTRKRDVPQDDKVISRSGLACLDFDGLDNAEAIRNSLVGDPFTCAAFLSPGGHGLKVLVRLADPVQFLPCWQSAVAYFATKYGLRADQARKDLCGLCYLSHDPDLYIADFDPDAFQPIANPTPVSTPPRSTATAIPEGERNTTLTKMAGAMRRQGATPEGILAALKTENAIHCETPLPDGEVVRIAKSVARYEPAAGPEPERWPEPRPLLDAATPPDLDLKAAIPANLPELADFIRQTSTALQVPVELVAPLVVSVASLGVARAMEVQCQPGWIEPAPVWVACLAEPGERKSALLASIARPVHQWQSDERKRLGPELAQYDEKRRQLEARLGGLRTAMAKPKGKDGACDLSTLQQQSAGLAAELASMPELLTPTLVTSEATPEAARELLACNGEKLAVITAEGDQLDVVMGRYGDGKANLGVFLAGHSGDCCPAHRVGRDLSLFHPALVCCFAIQPQAVEAVLSSPEAVGRGLVARFMFIRPRTWMGKRELEPAPVQGAIAGWWDQVIRRLLDMPWLGKVVLGPDGLMRSGIVVRVLSLTDEAHRILCDLRAGLELRLDRESGDLRHLSAFASKLSGAVSRIALAFQALADSDAEAVGTESMRAAICWAPFLIGHAQAVVGEASDPVGALARKVWRWIESGQRWTFTSGECYRDNRSLKVNSSDALTPAFDLLEAHNLIRRPPDEPGKRGPKGRRWEVNPATHSTDYTHLPPDGEMRATNELCGQAPGPASSTVAALAPLAGNPASRTHQGAGAADERA
jgi:hypothetical protein